MSVVWTPMLAEDTPAAIEAAAGEFAPDGIQQFVDPEQRVGRRVARALGGADGIAWDVYLCYAPDVRWTEEFPEPTEWVHQLDGCSWASPDRYRCGSDLTAELARVASRMVHHHSTGIHS